MKLTIDQIPCDLDPSQRIALDYDAQDLAGVHLERDVAHGVHGLFARAEVLGNVLEFDQVNSSFIPKANKKSGELMSSPLQVKRCSGGKTLLRAFNQRRQFRSCAYRAGK